MRCQLGEATKQDYLHAKQHKQQVTDRAKRSHNQRSDLSSAVLPHPVVNGNSTEACAPELATPLAKLFQYSYNTGIYLTMWKIVQ
eukprot:g23072.t1